MMRKRRMTTKRQRWGRTMRPARHEAARAMSSDPPRPCRVRRRDGATSEHVSLAGASQPSARYESAGPRRPTRPSRALWISTAPCSATAHPSAPSSPPSRPPTTRRTTRAAGTAARRSAASTRRPGHRGKPARRPCSRWRRVTRRMSSSCRPWGKRRGLWTGRRTHAGSR